MPTTLAETGFPLQPKHASHATDPGRSAQDSRSSQASLGLIAKCVSLDVLFACITDVCPAASLRKNSRGPKQLASPPKGRGFLFATRSVAILALIILALSGGRTPLGHVNSATVQPARICPTWPMNSGRCIRSCWANGYALMEATSSKSKGADENGRLEVGYFNPSPIHVARAEASGRVR